MLMKKGSGLSKFLELDLEYSRRLGVAERPGRLRNLAIVFAHSGDSWFLLAGMALLWLLGPSYWKERALAMIVATIITAVLVLLVKFTVRRRRPEGEWGSIYRSTDPHSFPSGHAARAALLAGMAIGMGPAWFGLLMVIWAPLVVLARVAMGVHYLSDVIAGAIIGAGMALIMLNWFSWI